MNSAKKIIVILGPTSSGKSEAAIRLAKKFDGEIISADSRQVYRGMDIGTGKIEGKIKKLSLRAKRSNLVLKIPSARLPRSSRATRDSLAMTNVFMSSGIPHYLIDILSPRTEYNVSQFKRDAEKIIENILRRGKLPIICGGTGFWIKAIVDNVSFPEVKPNKVLRNKLSNKTAEELFRILAMLDPERAKNIDAKNKVRLIRAIEICKALGKVPPLPRHCEGAKRPWQSRDCFVRRGELAMTESYDFLQIGLDVPKEKLHRNIQKRLRQRFATGMIAEVSTLKKKYNLSWKKIQRFGLGYFWIPLYLQGKIHPVKSSRKRGAALPLFNRVKTKEELFKKIYHAEKNYAKRQMTWFRKDTRIKWLPACEKGRKNYTQIKKETKKFLEKSPTILYH